jgi:hypothetical protein
VSLIAMLAALIMIIAYKDRCAGAVSTLMGDMAPQDRQEGAP